MKVSEMLLPEFDQEMKNTRRLLERVPVEKADWKPHEKSMALGRLAGHVAELPMMGVQVLKTKVFDISSWAAGRQPYVARSSDDLLRTFDGHVAEMREAVVGADDPHFYEEWSMQFAGKVLASGSRQAMIRSMVFNHLIHHRGQLGVYLRLNNVPLPSLYGPSADEGML